jgi:5-methylthioadenosine/S-adenosylhomocysteine deaminase
MASTGAPILLEGAVVLTLDADARVGRFTVAVEAGRIAAVLPPADASRRFAAAERVNCRGRILMPGLVNAHLHPDLHLLRGALENVGLHDWGASDVLSGALAMMNSPDGRWLQRAAVRASLLEAVLGGTTCVATYGVTTDSEIVCAEVLAEFGMRGAVTIRDAAFPTSPAGLPPSRPDGMGGPVRFYRLHAEEALPESELAAATAAHARGDRIVMHAAETAHRVALAEAGHGTTTVRLLHRYGLLSPRVLLSHAIHVDAEERALVAAAGAPVVASPAAEMKLGDGAGPFAAYDAAGVTLALGTDAAVCNNATDMLLECRALGLLQSHAFGPGALPAERILLAATRGGARALGLDGEIGSVAAGLAADLTLIDARNPRLQPLHWRGRHANVHASLVYAATGQDVTDVMIGGRWVVRRRKFLPADARTILRELKAAARALRTGFDMRR